VRIGIDITKALPPRDGIGNYTFHLARALIGLGCDHELRFCALAPQASLAQLRAVLGELPPNCSFVETASLGDAIDLFHAPSWDVPFGYRGPLVLTCHDLTFLTHPDFHLVDNKIHCVRAIVEAMVNEAHFLCVSRHTRNQVLRRLEVPEERTAVIYEGYDSIFGPGDRNAAAKRLRDRLDIRDSFILSVGSLEPRKNLLRLVKAYDGLPVQIRREYDLLLAGPPGWRNEDLHEHLRGRNASGNVRLLGYVDVEDQADLYRAASAFVYPSLAEGFGLPVLEALACGAPVAVSAASSLPEVAGDAALLFDPEREEEIREAIRRLLVEPDLASEMRERAVERASRFSWQRAASETVALYETLV